MVIRFAFVLARIARGNHLEKRTLHLIEKFGAERAAPVSPTLGDGLLSDFRKTLGEFLLSHFRQTVAQFSVTHFVRDDRG